MVISRDSSIVSFTVTTEAEWKWLDANADAEPWQWQGGTLCVDARCAPELFEAVRDAGFSWLFD